MSYTLHSIFTANVCRWLPGSTAVERRSNERDAMMMASDALMRDGFAVTACGGRLTARHPCGAILRFAYTETPRRVRRVSEYYYKGRKISRRLFERIVEQSLLEEGR